MTTETIDLTAIDRRIAEEVFGWKRLKGDQIIEWMKGWKESAPARNPHLEMMWVDGPEYCDLRACVECGSLPSFSSEPLEALRVIVRMQELGFSMTVCSMPGEPGHYFCMFISKIPSGAKFRYGNKLASLICMAALDAIDKKGA